MREEQSPSASRFSDLDSDVQKFLERLDPDNLESLAYLSSIQKEELQGLMKFIRDGKAVGKATKWAIITLFGLFLAVISIGQGVQWMLSFWHGKSPS